MAKVKGGVRSFFIEKPCNS